MAVTGKIFNWLPVGCRCGQYQLSKTDCYRRQTLKTITNNFLYGTVTGKMFYQLAAGVAGINCPKKRKAEALAGRSKPVYATIVTGYIMSLVLSENCHYNAIKLLCYTQCDWYTSYNPKTLKKFSIYVMLKLPLCAYFPFCVIPCLEKWWIMYAVCLHWALNPGPYHHSSVRSKDITSS